MPLRPLEPAVQENLCPGWDVTASDERYRGEPTSLGLMRFALGPELRGSIRDRLYWHGRLSPTLTSPAATWNEAAGCIHSSSAAEP